jgi:hypothetical protein
MSGDLDVRAIRRHFGFPATGRVLADNAASTPPPRELTGLYGQRGLFELLVLTPVAVIVAAATAYCLATRHRNPSPSHRERSNQC